MFIKRPLPAFGEARNELRYRGLFDPGRGFTFPCDAQCCVELDRLSKRVRVNYLFARATVTDARGATEQTAA
jgi:hypothetical protein